MRSILHIGSALVVLIAFGGCKRQHTESTREAINGAFGWALGARLPAAFDVQTNSGGLRYQDPRGNVPPFSHVTLDLTTNRTIWAITGTLSAASPGACLDLEKSLKEALEKKYPFQKKTSEGGVSRTHYGEVDREVILAMTTQPPTLALCYRDTAMARQAQQELAVVNAISTSGGSGGPSTGK